MDNKLNKYSPYIVLLLSVIVLYYFYSDILVAPNDFLFSSSGDGIKNYYTYLYHSKYDDSFSQFTGMNFPNGEQITYTDGQPLLSFIVKTLGLQEYGIGIMNTLILISFPISAFYISKIFRLKNVSVWINILASILIAFLGPQVLRIDGHYSLSYCFAIPLAWWLMIKLREGKWGYVLALFLLILSMFFTHPYLGLILALFSGLFFSLKWLVNRRKYVMLIYSFLFCVVPVIIFKLFTNLTDTHVNRDPNPSGFFTSYGNWRSIFTPYMSPYNKFYRDVLGIDHVNWETSAYIGLGMIILLIFLIVSIVVYRNKVKWKAWLNYKNDSVIFLFSSLLMVLLAFCIPFKYEWVKPILEILTPLKQFRSLGRFAWVFYYVFTIYLVLLLSKLIATYKYKWIPVFLFVLAMGFQAHEVYDIQSSRALKMSKQKNIFLEEHLYPKQKELISHLNEEGYDAFMFLPITHLSSEVVYLMGNQKSEFDSEWISYHTGLPMVNSATARMSLDEAFKINNLFGPKYIQKPYLDDIKEFKVAIVYDKLNIPEDQLDFVKNVKEKDSIGNFIIIQHHDSIFHDKGRLKLIKENASLAQYKLQGGFNSQIKPNYFYFNSFEEDSNSVNQGFYDERSRLGEKHEWNKIFDLSAKEIPNGDYKFSFWYSLKVDKPAVKGLLVEVFKNGKSKWRDNALLSNSTHIVENWCNAELDLKVTDSTDYYSFFIICGGNHNDYNIDAVMIRPVNTDVFKYIEINGREYLNYNNYLLSK